jgi:hypothetical protein
MIKEMKFNDTVHKDGSKTYETFNYGFITIRNIKLVALIETLLKTNGTGFFYVRDLQKFVDDGNDSLNEIQKAMRVLD